MGQKGEDRIREYMESPVSYTHLDVYKRQPLALELGEKFDEIMVDEYQDVNAVQDMIINALSDGRNLFLVGDVKQLSLIHI